MKIKEILFKTILNEGYEYENRYIYKGDLEDLTNYGFKKLSNGDIIEELKLKVGDNDTVYYKKSGLGYFIINKESDYLLFMSGVPVWWIGDEEETDYYSDLNLLLENGLIEKLEDEED